MKKRKTFILLLISSMLLVDIASAASNVVGIRSLNNEQRNIDYKVKSEALSKQADAVTISGGSKEIIQDSIERDSSQLTVPLDRGGQANAIFSDSDFASLTTGLSDRELNWLVENKIISRDSDIRVTSKNTIVAKPAPLYDRNQTSSGANRSDFLMGVYKALYGVIESRPLLFNMNSLREAQEIYYEEDPDTGAKIKKYKPKERQVVSWTGKEYLYSPNGTTESTEAQFDEGDYFTYVSPNVYELYLKELVDKQIISLDSIRDTRFKEAYGKIQGGGGVKTYPLWYNSLAPFLVMGGTEQPNDLTDFITNSRVLGKSYTISGVGDGFKQGAGGRSSVIEIHKSKPSYFVNEALTSMMALKYVEAMLRLTEKDMTDTEARIVTYKYGANYLDGLPEEDRKTVMFLTAQGILNFEDQTEYRNLYGNLTEEFSYKLLYRLANKDARTKFSEIQLTDSDNFWLGKGFNQLQMNFNVELAEVGSQLKDANGLYEISPIPEAVTESVEVISDNSAGKVATLETKSWFGIKVYTRESKLAAPADSAPNTYVITKVFDDYRKYKYKGVDMASKDFNKTKFPEMVSAQMPAGSKSKYQWQVKFQVNASNATVAVRTVDGNLAIATDKLFSTKEVTAVTKYTEAGEEVTLVPAAAFKDVKSDILIMEDKLLKNRNTGSMAVLLPDKNIALVGTHVVSSEAVMVTAIDGEIYYNLDIIKMLLSNVYISTLDPSSLYLTKNIYDEKLVTVEGTTGNKIGQTYVAKFKGKFAGGGDIGSAAPTVTSSFANMSQMTTATNYLIREFSKKDVTGKGEDMKFTLLLHLNYKLPDKNTNFTAPLYKSSNPSFAEVNSFLYTRPEDKQLADWWDNNLGLSNAFANVIYGTTGINYVKSGYLAPNITILYDKDNVKDSGFISEILKKVGGELPNSWVNRFMGDSKTYNLATTSSTDSKNKDSYYYPVPASIVPKEYPLWTYAMFNNSQGKVNNSGGNSPSVGIASSKYKNGTLWRYLMGDRTMDVVKGVSAIDQGSISYNTGSKVFVKTRADAVYMMIDPTDTKFPIEYKNNKLFIKTRSDENQRDYWEKSYVTAGGYTFFVSSISGNKMTLVDTQRISGTPFTTVRDNNTFYEIKGGIVKPDGSKGSEMPKAIETRYNTLRSVFSPIGLSMQNYENAMPIFAKAKEVTGKLPNNKTTAGIYFMDSSPANGYTATSKPFKDYTNPSKVVGKTLSEVGKGTVSANIKFTLDTNYWSVNDQGELVSRKTSPYLQVGNVYFSGLNQGMIDSIIAKSIGTIDPNKLENGSTLIVGDVELVKTPEGFVSKPQTKLSSWQQVLGNATNSTAVKSAINRMFVGYVVRVSNIDVPLASFISNQGLGVPSNGIKVDKTLVGSEGGGSTVYVASNNSSGGVVNSPYSSKKVPTIKSVIFKVSLDKNLLAREIDKETKTYQLLLSTNTLSEGYLENLPFFDESLSLGEKDDLYLMLDKGTFAPFEKAGMMRDDFNKLFEQAFKGDVLSWMRVILLIFLSFLMIMTWVVYAFLRFGIGVGFFEMLRNPGGTSSRNGFDIIRVMTLGMFNLDSEFPLYRLIVSNVLIMVLIYVLLDVIPIGGV